MSYWWDREIFKKVTGTNDPEAYWRFEGFLWILIGFFAVAVATVVGVVYVGFRLWNEIALEISYRQKYGANWQAEFERYHGSVAHAHARLLVVFFCLLALLAVLLWFVRQFYKNHKRLRHDRAS